MSGVPGQPGPVPKRSGQRRRRNEVEPVEIAPASDRVDVPPANPDWHPIALMLYESLPKSGQSVFFESTDWATAYLLAESVSRELSTGEAPKAASLAAWSKVMTSLLMTEGDRRRARLELERAPAAEDGGGDVSWLDDARERIRNSG